MQKSGKRGDKSVFPANTRGRRDRNFLVPSPSSSSFSSGRGTVNRTKILIGGCQEGEGGKKERCRGKTVEWRNRAKLSTFLVIRRFYSRKKKKRKRKRGSKATLTTRRITGFLSSARENFSNFSRFSRTTCFHRLYSTDHLTIRVSIVPIFFSFKRGTRVPLH